VSGKAKKGTTLFMMTVLNCPCARAVVGFGASNRTGRRLTIPTRSLYNIKLRLCGFELVCSCADASLSLVLEQLAAGESAMSFHHRLWAHHGSTALLRFRSNRASEEASDLYSNSRGAELTTVT
jgi:hypothetical protein